ncbi:helix-turn-helix domain-containing protein [Micromonospora arborensis]|uniref:helix-turn-helix domain-containing protein n=1 Tax=Micromonospora arborensis TaxID=2116518 RepID=UPI0037146463
MTMGELRPDDAADPAEFIEMLRQLKDRSRLTYRQLEQRAASAGDVLARSTAADILRRSTLPRPEVVAAFVRACGAEEQVEAWLRARHRLAAGTYALASPTPDHQPDDGTTSDRPPADGTTPSTAPAATPSTVARARWFARPAPLALLAVGALLAALAVIWIQRPDDVPRTPTQLSEPTSSASGSPAGTPDGSARPSTAPSAGRSQIRPARNPQLCLTDGQDPTGQYATEVAVQRPCAEATPPDTYLLPVTSGLYFIKWDHPVHGAGCLTMIDVDPGRKLLEPWEDCREDRWTQLFRFEPTGSAPSAYRIRPARTDLCVGLRDDDSDEPAEALVEPCTTNADQVFLVDALPQK